MAQDRGQQDQDDAAARERDAARLRALEERLSQRRGEDLSTPGADKFAQANQAWRMVVELVAGIVVGFGMGYGLDWLLGTRPIMLVIFIFLGFAAGVKTMMRTAAEMATGSVPPAARTPKNTGPAAPAGNTGPAEPAGLAQPGEPAGTKGTERGD